MMKWINESALKVGERSPFLRTVFRYAPRIKALLPQFWRDVKIERSSLPGIPCKALKDFRFMGGRLKKGDLFYLDLKNSQLIREDGEKCLIPQGIRGAFEQGWFTGAGVWGLNPGELGPLLKDPIDVLLCDDFDKETFSPLPCDFKPTEAPTLFWYLDAEGMPEEVREGLREIQNDLPDKDKLKETIARTYKQFGLDSKQVLHDFEESAGFRGECPES